MRKQSAALAVFASLTLAFCLFSCRKTQKTPEYFAEASKFIYAYTSGSVSVREPIRVRFSLPAVAAEQVGQTVASGLFSIAPKVAGEAKWADAQTLVFEPSEDFPRGKKMTARLELGRIFKNAPKICSVFEWDFEARQLDLMVEIDGLRAEDDNDLSKQMVAGSLQTNDRVAAELAEKCLVASQNVQNLPISWSHAADGQAHAFLVKGISRGQKASEVELKWSGDALGIGSKKGVEKVEVPAIWDFKAISARVETDEEMCAVINFSDPISPSQNLEGLIFLQGWTAGKFRFQIDRNDVRCYPTAPVSGTYKLKISQGVKNTAGASMKNGAEFDLVFEEMKPRVRLVGKGAIIPREGGGPVLFPFEAVSLKAVDIEVFKIYNSNIPQFFQTNELEGENELERVGKIVLQKKVDLASLGGAATGSAWKHFALDLRPFIDADPSALYSVRIGFRPSYIDFSCKTGGEWMEKEDGPALNSTDEFGNLRPIFGNDYYGLFPPNWANGGDGEWFDGDDDRWDYSFQNDPCRREFYSKKQFAERNVFVSNLGLTAKRGSDGSTFVAVTDLLTASPVSSCQIDFYDFQLQKIASGSTDGSGLANLTVKMQPFLMVASRGSEKGYLKMADGASLSMSRFDVAGVEPQKGMKGFLYGERGVWRPGDTIFLNFMLEDRLAPLPDGHPVTLDVRDSRGGLAARQVNSSPVGGLFSFKIPTRSDAPTGNWTAKVAAGGAHFEKTLMVETVKPNRLKVELDFGKTAFSKNDADGFSGKLNVRWLHGAAGNGLRSTVEMTLRPAKTEFSSQKGVVFDDPARRFSSEPQVIFDGSTGSDGTANVSGKLETNGTAPGKLMADFRLKAFEKTGEFSTDRHSMEVWPFDFFVGVKIPEDRWGSKSIDQKNGSEIRFVAVDRKGNPQAGRKILVGLYRLDWRWWYENDGGEQLSQFASAEHTGAVDQITLTTDAKGEAKWTAKVGGWGRYLVRAVDAVGGHAAGDFAYTGWPDDGSDNIRARNYAAFLPFSAEKEAYSTGETVNLKIPGGEAGRVLVTLENGSRVVQSFWQETRQGENSISFKATAEMSPSIYAHVSLVQPHAQTKNDLPIRLYGIVPIKVDDPSKRLDPTIEMADVLSPDDPFSIKISEKTGKAMAYTLAVVDEGLLDLTSFETPDPAKIFNAREALGVKTWDLYDYVLGAHGAEIDRILAIGGDGINQKSRSGAQVNRFKPVVRHLGPFQLKKGETATHRLKIENYVGSVRAMVVACSKNEAYGMTEKTAPVRKPVMVLPTLPRVLGPGEKISLPVTVFAMEKKVRGVEVTVSESSGLIAFSGEKSRNLTFSQPGDQLTTFDLTVGNRVGKAVFTIAATGGGERMEQKIEVEIGNPNPFVSSVLAGEAEPSASWTKNFQPIGTDSRAVLEVSALPAMNLSQHLEWLIQYPHGCAEQTTSAAFPQLYVDALTPLSKEKEAEISKNIKAAIAKLTLYQSPDGGFSYWSGGGWSDAWCSSYVAHFLVEAKAKGYEVPSVLIEKWAESAAKQAKTWDFQPNSNRPDRRFDEELAQSYRLFVLAKAGKSEVGAMNRMRERGRLFRTAGHTLAAAYALAGKGEIGQAVLADSKFQEDRKYEGWCGSTYGSWMRDAAMILETYLALGQRDQAEQKMRFLAQSLGSDNWFGTQDRSMALAALGKYASKMGDVKNSAPSFTWSAGGKSGKITLEKPISTVEMPDATSVTVKNESGVRLFCRLVLTGKPLVGDQSTEAENIALEVKYFDSKNQPIDPTTLVSGTDFVAEITVAHKGVLSQNFGDLALVSVFPGGWEIGNSRLGTGNFGQKTGENSIPEYQDFRDDRVLTYFGLPNFEYKNGKSEPAKRVFRVNLTAACPGRYYLPTMSCESMYDRRVRAKIAGRWVTVAADEARRGG